jgi:glucose-6-phosphate dehydrogenase assembly protein OpcA
MVFDDTPFGIPVALGQIGRELKKLWERDSGVSTRASLINFAVCCEGAEAMRANTELIMQFTREHACRAILIGYEPRSEQAQIHAWINAHCHLSRAGAKQVCCEQISFLFEGDTKDRISNILFANLDSDLPLVLWWQGEFFDPIDVQLWSWVDRLIYDSQSWGEPKRQFALLRESVGQSRLALCDLNWTRSLHLRQALAQMFDYPENLALLDRLTSVDITHASGYRSTALLLAGWVAAQLKLELTRGTAGKFVFRNSQNAEIEVALRTEAGRSISRCELRAPDSAVCVQRDAAGDFFRVEVRLPNGSLYNHLLPAGCNETAALLLEEIGGAGRHRVYLKALAVAEALL